MSNSMSDQPGERRIGWYAWEVVGLGSIHLEDMVLAGSAVRELVDGKVQYRLLGIDGHPTDHVYREN